MRNNFQRAAQFQQRHGDATLVHALVREAHMHCWVELAGRHVYDPVISGGNLLDLDEYREKMRPVTEWRYNPSQAARLVAATGHFGPWSDVPNLDTSGDPQSDDWAQSPD